MAWIHINPMLKGINRGNPRQDLYDSFKKQPVRSLGVGRRVKSFESTCPQELHAHGSDFTEFDRGLAISCQGLATRGERVKRVAALMKDRAQIAVDTNGVHKYERKP